VKYVRFLLTKLAILMTYFCKHLSTNATFPAKYKMTKQRGSVIPNLVLAPMFTRLFCVNFKKSHTFSNNQHRWR